MKMVRNRKEVDREGFEEKGYTHYCRGRRRENLGAGIFASVFSTISVSVCFASTVSARERENAGRRRGFFSVCVRLKRGTEK